MIDQGNGRIRSIGRDPPVRRRRGGVIILAIAFAVFLAGGTLVSYYVDALWFDSLGYGAVFWTRINLQAATFAAFALLSFAAIYGAFLALKPARFDQLIGGRIMINQQWVQVPIEPVLKLVALGAALVIAVANAGGMMASWTTFALFWDAPPDSSTLDPIFGRPLGFYLFTLPAWQLIVGWLLTLSVIGCLIAGAFVLAVTRARNVVERGFGAAQIRLWRALSIAVAVLLMVLALHAWLGRFERLFQDNTIFAGVGYTDAHIALPGTLVVCVALLVGAAIAVYCAIATPAPRWLLAAAAPAAVCYLMVGLVSGYVSSFIVKPNQLVRERPFIAHNIEMTRRAYALDRIEPHPFPAETTVAALDGRPQPDHARQHPAVGLARAAGHAAPDPGDPHLLRLSRHRHRSLHDRRRTCGR